MLKISSNVLSCKKLLLKYMSRHSLPLSLTPVFTVQREWYANDAQIRMQSTSLWCNKAWPWHCYRWHHTELHQRSSPYYIRADSRFVLSQWEMALLCNDVSHWLSASLESALEYAQDFVSYCFTLVLLTLYVPKNIQIFFSKFFSFWSPKRVINWS